MSRTILSQLKQRLGMGDAETEFAARRERDRERERAQTLNVIAGLQPHNVLCPRRV